MLISPESLTTLKSKLKNTILLGNEPTPELAAIMLVYFVQGILGLARLAISFFLKDELGLTPTETAALVGVVVLPWTLKPLIGFLSDGLPVLGYHRRPYLILAGVMGSLSWVAFGTIVNTPLAATITITFTSLSVAISDVIVDSIVAQRARSQSQSAVGSLQSLCWGSSAVGGIITAYLGGILLEYFTSRTIFLITALFPLIVLGVAGLINEQKTEVGSNWQTVRQQVKLLRQAISQKNIWLPTLFILIWQATPSADSAFFYFTTNELGFQPEFLGRVRLVTSVAALLGVWLFQRYFKSVPFRRIFFWSTILSTGLGLTTLILVTHANRAIGIDDHWFSLGDSVILTVVGEMTLMPLLVLAARLCPPGVEATLFALVMSVFNLGGLISHELGAILTHLFGVTETNFEHLWMLMLVTNLSTLLVLPFVRWLPDTTAVTEEVPIATAEASQLKRVPEFAAE
ncbi:MAG: folate/biopterin family MFS transporter [Microcoleaceae cyanobacterium]